MNTPAAPQECRVLALGLSAKDAAFMKSAPATAGMQCVFCRGSSELAQELQNGAGALMVTEEAVLGGAQRVLVEFVRHQPKWSELPVLILTTRDSNSPAVAQFMELLGNVTLIERPMRIAVLMSALRVALRARQRQYQIRAYLAERERSEESLRETGRRKDEFLAALAHELRNPLAPISNTLHLLNVRGNANPDAQWAHDIIERQVKYLTRLVDDLLDVSRITRGKLSLRCETVELGNVIQNALETSRPLIEAAQHRIEVQLPPTPVQLNADPVRLAQALSNLLNNAAKYTPNGGRIGLSATVEEDCAVVRVKDNGIGIEPHLLPRVFELFLQADNGLGRAQGGLGIGLTLVRTFVGLHAGTVEALSQGPGRGSEFVVRLPVLAAEGLGASGRETADAAIQTPPPRRILVVDDNQDGAQSLASLLQMQGNEVHTVYDGPQAVAAMQDFQPDVVLLDIGLPTLNGYETVRRMRAPPCASHALIIALTGWGQEEDRRRSREAGFDHHLVKPVDFHALQTLLADQRLH